MNDAKKMENIILLYNNNNTARVYLYNYSFFIKTVNF